jgi:hypothetical protein
VEDDSETPWRFSPAADVNNPRTPKTAKTLPYLPRIRQKL